MGKTKSRSDGASGRRKKCKRAFQLDCTANARESYDRKQQGRERMKLNLLQRQVEKKKQELLEFEISTPKTTVRLEKGNRDPEKWVLRGAARPAALIARIKAGELDQHGNEIYVPETIDLYNKHMGNFWDHKETKELLELTHKLAEESAAAGYSKQAIEHFNRCLSLDTKDRIKARDGLVAALLDEGRAGEARALMENFNLEARTVFSYSKLLTEYVAWAVLKEEDASEELVLDSLKKAFQMNPYIPVFICGYEIFSEVVECLDEIEGEVRQGSVEECFLYCSRNIGVWMDTEGIRDWLANNMGNFEEPICTEDSADNPMFSSMYNTAVEMIREEAELASQEEADDTDNSEST